MSVRLCLVCENCSFSPRTSYTACDTCGPETGDDTSFECRKGHFTRFLYSRPHGEQLMDLENALLSANTCPDFKERT